MQPPSLQRYQIMQALGAGAQGSIFRGIDRDTQREVAIKVYHLKGATDWGAFDRFERECNLLAQLDHPGIPKFLSHFAEETSGDYFLVMELIQGQNLQEGIRAGLALDPTQVTALLFQGLSILGHIHAHKPPVIHRDIKPANLILDPRGDLKLLDFGGAIERKKEEESGNTMTILGTPGYMAPEQSLGQANAASDLYALGVSMLAVCSACEGSKMPRQGLEIDIDALLAPSPLREVLRGCIWADAEKRFPSAAHAYAVLQNASSTSPGYSPQRPHAPPPFQPSPPRSPPQSPHEPQPSSNVPAPTLNHDLEQLAKVQSPPLRFLLWFIATAGIGVITVLRTFMLPLIEAIMRSNQSGPRRSDSGSSNNSPRNIQKRLSHSQRQLEAFANKTSPFEER